LLKYSLEKTFYSFYWIFILSGTLEFIILNHNGGSMLNNIEAE